jgi:hypothetical protein
MPLLSIPSCDVVTGFVFSSWQVSETTMKLVCDVYWEKLLLVSLNEPLKNLGGLLNGFEGDPGARATSRTLTN